MDWPVTLAPGANVPTAHYNSVVNALHVYPSGAPDVNCNGVGFVNVGNIHCTDIIIDGTFSVTTPFSAPQLTSTSKVVGQRLELFASTATDIIAIKPGNDLNPTFNAIVLGDAAFTAFPFTVTKAGKVTAAAGFFGNLTGNVTGNVTGGASSFTDLTISGNVVMNGGGTQKELRFGPSNKYGRVTQSLTTSARIDITANAYYVNGTGWLRDDTSQPSAVLGVGVSGNIGIYTTAAGTGTITFQTGMLVTGGASPRVLIGTSAVDDTVNALQVGGNVRTGTLNATGPTGGTSAVFSDGSNSTISITHGSAPVANSALLSGSGASNVFLQSSGVTGMRAGTVTRVAVSEVILAANATVTLTTLCGSGNYGFATIVAPGAAIGEFWITGPFNTVSVVRDYVSSLSATDTGSGSNKICVFPSGTSGVFTMVNRFANPVAIAIHFMGMAI